MSWTDSDAVVIAGQRCLADEPLCEICHRGIGDFTCAECGKLLCCVDARWNMQRRRYYCEKHEPEAGA